MALKLGTERYAKIKWEKDEMDDDDDDGFDMSVCSILHLWVFLP